MIGKTLGHYEILSPLGAGGMGQVYRARDTKLDRDVAIKVLPEDFASDAGRLARFEREAKLLASLNHPNIATIFGFEESDGVRFIAMELVEGQSLADRIEASGRIKIDEALEIARQIALALEAAHEASVIHRDLKPANVQVTPDGTVKVLDFGLAKAYEAQGSEPSSDLSHSPTMMAATGTGVIMGTAPYMSPEQARGQSVDKRSDIWSFGCVLYEMLTGRRAFDGETVGDTLAAILKDEPDLGALPANTPAAVRRLLSRCLEKDPSLRLRDAGDARLEVLDGLAGADVGFDPPAAAAGLPRLVPALVATAIVAAVLSGVAVWSLIGGSPNPASQPSRWIFEPPDGARFTTLGGAGPWLPYPPVALSPDGNLLAYAAAVGEEPVRLWLRDMDSLDVRSVPGTEGAGQPFFSPDGERLVFWADGVVLQVRVDAGRPERIADFPQPLRGAAWTDDGAILLGSQDGLWRLADGAPPALLNPLRVENPHVLPGGGIVFTVAGGRLAVLFPDGTVNNLPGTDGAAQPHYLDSGHLVFFRSGGLAAASFDPVAGELTGAVIPVVDDVLTGWVAGADLGIFALSDSGNLVHFAGDNAFEQNRIVVVDRQGAAEALPGNRAGKYTDRPVVSSAGTVLAISDRGEGMSSQVWSGNLDTGAWNVLTPGFGTASIRPVWTTDAARLFFSSGFSDSNGFDIYRMRPDGSDQELMLSRPHDQFARGISRDYLVFTERHPVTGYDIYLWALDGGSEPVGVATTPANEFDPSFSPDGKYLAYVSDETGRDEVYVKPVEGSGKGEPLSPDGGVSPRWSPAGDELFYVRGSTMMAVSVELEPAFRQQGPPIELFTEDFDSRFEVIPAGPHFVEGDTRFMMLTFAQPELTQLIVKLNWAAELNRLVPTDP